MIKYHGFGPPVCPGCRLELPGEDEPPGVLLLVPLPGAEAVVPEEKPLPPGVEVPFPTVGEPDTPGPLFALLLLVLLLLNGAMPVLPPGTVEPPKPGVVEFPKLGAKPFAAELPVLHTPLEPKL